MNLKEKSKSIQFKLFTIMCIEAMLVILIIIIVNNIVLETFYMYSRTETAKTISREINNYYNSAIKYDINSEIRQLEIKNNIEILIENENSEILYSGNKDLISVVSRIKKSITLPTIYKSGKYAIKMVDDTSSNKFLMLISNMDNGYIIYIKIPITPIKESVRISNEALLVIGFLMIIISACLSSFISKKFTKPIIELNKITKKMSELKFDEKYRITDTDDEINKLGKNINEMSDKLQITIEQLRQNNNELEKDIEKKSKIDEMRKQFISDVSHELKTPIGLIQGYAEGLLENVNNDEESRKFYAEVILDESKKMDTMVKRLLELMKLEYQDRQFKDVEYDLAEQIKEEIRRNTVILEENKIDVEFEEINPIKVFADQEYIEQVLSNYFTNAIKHCIEKSGERKIVIRTEKRENSKIRLYVYNTGDQISKEYIDKIWGRFYKIDSSRNRECGGTGIGLALVKAIMNNYHNDYGVCNYDNGVEFYCDINTK